MNDKSEKKVTTGKYYKSVHTLNTNNLSFRGYIEVGDTPVKWWGSTIS